MRKVVFLVLGILEMVVAAILVALAWQLPGSEEVHDRFGRVERVSKETSLQVGLLRDRVNTLRERRPQLEALSDNLREQLRVVGGHLRKQKVDYDSVRTVEKSMGSVAKGLDDLSTTLDPKGIGQISLGLKTTADYLDKKVAPAAEKSADHLEKTTALLQKDAQRLHALLKQAPPDLKLARQVHKSLAQFEDGLTRMERIARFEKLKTMREGFKGLESALSTGAGQVEKLADYSYPVVRIEGFKTVVEQRDFWPDGKTIAQGMRKAAKGVTAAGEELDGIAKDLPKLQQSVAESRKLVTVTRTALAKALEHEDKLEPLLKNVPEHTARLAEELPKLSGQLAKILRDTSRLRQLAEILRKSQKSVDEAISRWPQLRENLGKSATLLRATQEQLQQALEQREVYEASLTQTLGLLEVFASALPLMTAQLDAELRQQQESLDRLGDSIDEVTVVLPECAAGASKVLQTTRWLLGLVAIIFALHGGYLMAGWKLDKGHTA